MHSGPRTAQSATDLTLKLLDPGLGTVERLLRRRGSEQPDVPSTPHVSHLVGNVVHDNGCCCAPVVHGRETMVPLLRVHSVCETARPPAGSEPQLARAAHLSGCVPNLKLDCAFVGNDDCLREERRCNAGGGGGMRRLVVPRGGR